MSMKKFTTLALAGLVATSVFGQQPTKPMRVATPEQISATASNVKNKMLLQDDAPGAIVRSNTLPMAPTPTANGKITAVNPVTVGSASNVFTCLRGEQNQVFANNALNSVGFIHRNNASIYGGTSGGLRYDISIDGGMTWGIDIGELNPTGTLPTRYPNGAFYNEAPNTNPLSAHVVSNTPTLGTPTWDGHFNGYSSVATASGTAPSTRMEHYQFATTGTLLPGGLTERVPGEFWSVDLDYTGGTVNGPIKVFKGTVATGDITWAQAGTLTPNHDLVYDGTVWFAGGPNIEFSPVDPNIGWIAWLGDLAGGATEAFAPCFSKTTDGGATWGTPVEMDMTTVPWLVDTLQSLWVDTTGNPASDGIPSTAFDMDLTVDANGNPHLAVVIGTHGAGQAYSFASGLAKFMGDVYSPDGGATWDIAYISPVLTFRTPAFGATGTTVTMDNQPQISRSEDGEYVFFAWADTDTALVTGNQNGIGLGESDNLAPNLRIAGLNVNTWEQTYPELVTDGDLLWEGRALWPALAPVCLTGTAGCYKLPIVIAAMGGSNEPIDPATFWYFGNDAEICVSSMCDPASMQLGWSSFAFTGAQAPCLVGVDNNVESNVVLGNAFPNPTSGASVITFELPAVSSVTMDLVNVYGQQVAVLANGEFAAGSHRVDVSTDKLASGVYFYSLRTNGQVISKKLVVSK